MAGAARRSRTFSASWNDFPGAELIAAEQNYRSTSNILSAANALIENNNGRRGKKALDRRRRRRADFAVLRLQRFSTKRLVVNRIKPGGERCAGVNAPFSIAVTPRRAL